ncbi:MAG: hypothetical protein Q4D91_09895 [Lautropia sp.]|nr:hypothetical protein [Lautropia sp.]
MKTFDVKLRISALAAMMLLAGCGGQGSTPSGSLSSQDGAASGTPITKAPAASTPEAAGTMASPYDEQSIRGDVLATALTQMVVAPVDGKAVPVKLHEYDIHEEARVPALGASPVFIEQLIGPDTTGKQLGAYVSDLRLFDQKDPIFEGIRFQMGLSHAGALPAGNAQDNATVLTVGKNLLVSVEPNTPSVPPISAGPYALEAKTDLAITLNGVYKKSAYRMMVWDDPNTRNDRNPTKRTEVILSLSGSATPANTFELCLQASGFGEGCPACNLPRLNREVCTKWQIPEGWQAGQPLVPLDVSAKDTDEYTRHDSDGQPYDMQARSKHWRTMGEAPFDDTTNIMTMPRSAGNPLNRNGVSGALFATLLDSAAERSPDAIPKEMSVLHAVTKIDGERLNDAPAPQQLHFFWNARAYQFADGQLANHPGYSPAATALEISQISMPPASSPDTGHLPRTRVLFDAEIQPLAGQPAVLVPEQLILQLPAGPDGRSNDKRLKAREDKRLGIPQTARVGFNTVRSWTGELEDKSTVTVGLELKEVEGQHDQVALCWRIEQSGNAPDRLHRLSCLRWHVPGNWQYGQGLKATGAYVLDRQPQTEDGTAEQYRYWQSAAVTPAP